MSLDFLEREVVITGAAISSPAGNSLTENLNAWTTGEVNFVPHQSHVKSAAPAKYIGVCHPPDIGLLHDKKIKKVLAHKDLIGLCTLLKSALNADVNKGDINPKRFGLFIGAAAVQTEDMSPYFGLIDECLMTGGFNGKKFGCEFSSVVNPMVMLQTLLNNTLCYGAIALDIRGVNTNFMDLQIAGLRAVGEGYLNILEGRADIIIAGGVSNLPEPYHALEGINAGFLARTDTTDVSPNSVVKPFDSNRTGTILSEASAFVVMEEKSHAINRGANILGKIKGFSLTSDGYLTALKFMRSKGLIAALAHLYDGPYSKMDLNKLSFIASHANGCVIGDAIEADAYIEFFPRSQLSSLPVYSLKGALGETSEAGGVISLISALYALKNKSLPPTRNFSSPDNYSKYLKISNHSQASNNSQAIIVSQCLTGLNCCIGVEVLN